jgi:alkanesulfonate monooxygenase SsuD/methylene tetrahydromethanopterin reductase-like flavin-dependent oxidoreductase (luciferase family)
LNVSVRSSISIARTGLRAGHAAEQLTVGVHAMGFVGETTAKAKDAFFPGWAYLTTKVGRERGWSAPTRQQFEAMASPEGAFLIGAPARVASKMLMPAMHSAASRASPSR